MQHQDLSRISSTTRAVALLGYPVAHSLSPAMHNAAFAAAGLDYCYLALEVRPVEIQAALEGLRALNFAGINVTVPHKEAVLPLLDELTEEAQAIRAVNTAANRNGRWIGTNTDAAGFRKLLEVNGLSREGMKAVVLGAGGAARATLYVLARLAREVVLFNRTLERAERLLRTLEPYRGGCGWEAQPLQRELLEHHMAQADLLVNTTSVGMHPDEEECPLSEDVEIPARCSVVDLIYKPPKTRLLRLAERCGAKAVNGNTMLLYQAVEAFKFWTGIEPDVQVMEQRLHPPTHINRWEEQGGQRQGCGCNGLQ